MPDPVKLYNHSQASDPRRVRIFAAEEGIELSPEEVNILAGQSLTPEFLAKSSSGGVPVRQRSHRPISPPHSVPARSSESRYNGKMVWAGADACAIDLGIKRQWDKWSDGCSDVEYVTIAKAEIENGKTLCDRYSQ
jgi:hypothetical protein